MAARFLSVVLLGPVLACACGSEVLVEEPTGGGGSGSGTTTGSASSTAVTAATTGGGPCDDHADCAPGLCIFGTGQCAAACEPSTCDACGPGSVCEPCATSSCPDCKNCVSACVPISQGRCDDNDACLEGFVCVFFEGVCRRPCDPMGQCEGLATCDFCATGSCCGCDDCVAVCQGTE